MNFQEWQATVPEALTIDALWRVKAHRLALFMIYVAWSDCEKITQGKRHFALADQLYRAIGSVAANISEGYSRHSTMDQARFYNYALGSAREVYDWYYAALPLLGSDIVQHRYSILKEITALLVTMSNERRSNKKVREADEIYEVEE